MGGGERAYQGGYNRLLSEGWHHLSKRLASADGCRALLCMGHIGCEGNTGL